MGAGKSSTGRKLASKLGWSFVDSDKQIEDSESRSVAQIFKEEGESHFRSLEKQWIESFADNQCVIAVGGGTPCHHSLDDMMLEKGLCIWFDAPIGMLAQRVIGSPEKRPLLTGLDDDAIRLKLQSLLKDREEIYGKAHLIIQVSKVSINDLAGYINLVISGKS